MSRLMMSLPLTMFDARPRQVESGMKISDRPVVPALMYDLDLTSDMELARQLSAYHLSAGEVEHFGLKMHRRVMIDQLGNAEVSLTYHQHGWFTTARYNIYTS